MSTTHPFDTGYYKNLAELLHDSQIDINQATSDIYNDFISKIFFYLEACSPLNEDEISSFSDLLNHPKKMVRAISSVHLMARGHVKAWPVLLETAAPMFLPEKADKEGWKSYWATQAAQSYLIRSHRELRRLGLSPTLEEMEERWLTEDRPKYRTKLSEM